MNIYKPLVCSLLFWFCAVVLKAQCPDFLDLNGPNVTGYYGYTYNPMSYTGIVPGRHTLITEQGTDPRTGGQLPLLPPGESAVIKLGNEYVGAEAESLVYTFIVDPDQPILILKYAVVLEDPNHPSEIQPRFTIQMLNADDELLSPCMEYDVISSSDIPGFQPYLLTMWRPWTLNGFDLSFYSGQTVKLKVTTFDCGAGAHYGYAYFTASCISNHLTISGCNGDQVTLSAPSGFESYLWSNGNTSNSTTYTIQNNTTASCSITTVTGCQVIFSATFLNENIPTQNQIIYDTICQGESYQNHGFILPPQENSGDIAVFNTYFDMINCTESATYSLFLHIIPRYTHIYDIACEGQDYHAYGFDYQNLVPGIITDTLHFVVGSGCDSSAILHLSVKSLTPTPLVLNGPTELCGRSLATYSLQNTENFFSYQWSVSDGGYVVLGNGLPWANVYFSAASLNPSEVTLSVLTGCGIDSVSFPVTVYPAYQYMYSDTICKGTDYDQHGFHLGVQENVGLFVHTKMDTTTIGCDSIAILQLFVVDTPHVTVVPDPAVLCLGNETTIHAITPNSSVLLNSDLPKIRVGDILCTDNTFVHPENWPTNKTPKAIVYYVDITGEHGWAIRLHDDGMCSWEANIPWSGESNVPNLFDYQTAREAIYDQDGYQNTSYIRDFNAPQYHPAAYLVDFEDGWYLPAAGQIYHLYVAIPFINPSLQLVGGTPIPTNTEWNYWSSTEINSGSVWILNSLRGIYYWDKVSSALVRSIRSF